MIDLLVDGIQFFLLDKPIYFLLFILFIFVFAYWKYRMRNGKFALIRDDEEGFKFSSDFGYFSFIKKESKVVLSYFERKEDIILHVDDIRQVSFKKDFNSDAISKFLDGISMAVDSMDPVDMTVNLLDESLNSDASSTGSGSRKMKYAIIISGKDYKDYPVFVVSQGKARSFYDEFVVDILSLLRLVDDASFRARDVFSLIKPKCELMDIEVYDYS